MQVAIWIMALSDLSMFIAYAWWMNRSIDHMKLVERTMRDRDTEILMTLFTGLK